MVCVQYATIRHRYDVLKIFLFMLINSVTGLNNAMSVILQKSLDYSIGVNTLVQDFRQDSIKFEI